MRGDGYMRSRSSSSKRQIISKTLDRPGIYGIYKNICVASMAATGDFFEREREREREREVVGASVIKITLLG